MNEVWRLPGRRRRLKCQKRTYGAIWQKYSHYSEKQCKWCGEVWKHGAEMEIGRIEQFRFIIGAPTGESFQK